MNVTRPPFGAPIMCIDDFLPAEDALKALQECIDLKKIYLPGTIFDGTNKTREEIISHSDWFPLSITSTVLHNSFPVVH
jgi:hypothetical protein